MQSVIVPPNLEALYPESTNELTFSSSPSDEKKRKICAISRELQNNETTPSSLTLDLSCTDSVAIDQTQIFDFILDLEQSSSFDTNIDSQPNSTELKNGNLGN